MSFQGNQVSLTKVKTDGTTETLYWGAQFVMRLRALTTNESTLYPTANTVVYAVDKMAGYWSVKTIYVTEAAAAIHAALETTIALTITSSGNTEYFADHFMSRDVLAEGTGSKFFWDRGPSTEEFIVDESPTAIATARAALKDSASVPSPLVFTEPFQLSVQTGLTAFATGGQANATQITEGFADFTTVATAGDSGKLPAAAEGKLVVVKNSGANPMDLFPFSGDSIDAGAVDAAISLPPGAMKVLIAKDTTVWETQENFVGGLVIPAQGGAGGPYNAISSANSGKTLVHLDDAGGNGYFEVTTDNYGFTEPYYWIADTTAAGGAGSKVFEMFLKDGFALWAGATGDIIRIEDISGVQAVHVVPNGVVADPSLQVGQDEDGFYRVGVNQLGVSVNNALATIFESDGVHTDAVFARAEPMTAAAGCSVSTYGDGRNYTTEITLTSPTIAIAGAAAEANGVLLATFPAGAHLMEVTRMNVALQGTGTVDADTPDVGIGSVIATGAVAILGGTPTFEDYITGQTAADCNGTATVAFTPATAGYGVGISLNETGDAKTVHLNVADTWAGADTITATGTVVIKWTVMD